MNNPVLELAAIEKSYSKGSSNKIEVLKGVNLKLFPGETVALVAPSGAGKSTLLQISGLLDKPLGGKIFINGTEIQNKNDNHLTMIRRREIGFVYQFHHLLPELTALENIGLPALLAGTNQAEAIKNASLLLEQVNLSGKENNAPNELSGGERQRVAIARAMSNNPSCLIMDEPTGNLDTKNVENFMTLLMDMVSIKNVTLLIATHDTKVSSRLDRLISLE